MPTNEELIATIDKLQKEVVFLKKERDQYKTIADYAHDWESWVDDDGNFIYVSPSCERITGYKPVDFYHDKNLMYKIIHKDDVRSYKKHKETYNKEKERSPFEFRLYTKHGEQIWIGHVCQDVYDINGKKCGIRSSNRPITKRKNAELKLKLLSSIVEQSPASIVVTNTDGDIEYVNKAFSRATGYSFEEAIGKNPRILKTEKTKPEVHKNMWETITKGEAWIGEFVNQKKNGYEYYENALIAPILDENNKIVNYFAIKENITKRKKAEHALRESEQKYKTIVELMGEGLAMTDYKGDIHYANPSVGKIYGIEAKKLKGKNLSELFGMEQLDIMEKQINALDDIEKNTYEIKFTNAKGKNKNLLITAAPLYAENYSDTKVISVFRDITKIKENEMMLKEALAAKDKFFRIIAHDLRNPFNSILGFSKMLKKKHNTCSVKERSELIDFLVDSGERTYELLENLLHWAKAHTGSLKINPEYYNLQLLIMESIMVIEDNAKNKNIRIEQVKSEDFKIFCDVEMIKTVLRNLLTNSIKFTNEGGLIKVGAKQKNDEIVFAVEDNGVGISDKKQKSLFDITQITTTPGTNNEEGTGLGLLLCKEFIEKHKGRIWFESEEGKGSVFYFSVSDRLIFS